ncbi:lysophospholipase L1-like esterase [Kitasatospora sp. GAS204A]|uniref:SGNH/GDSL hydrolase family protein n=1 Tax=unclassified Kitasatospora TaxID=2633591 RepID=UPI002476F88A|nr:SGNH/GDSL hydrolase family protein [Kitasatospora sp. GAS204B]MDH6116804.1 lysophospholipase L1-like esterase [Kitasatospora sp. GAS204B]
MRLLRALRTLGTTVAALGLAAAGQLPAHADTAQPSYYLALGDSLSQGYQPGQGNTDQGYVDDVYAGLRLTHPNLQLVKLGCTGETSVTMLNGGHCAYAGFPSQLAAAEDFLSTHQGQVAYLTINIGANDISACVTPTGVDSSCVPQAMRNVSTNLPLILSGLDAAAGGRAPVSVGMGTYDPVLAAWLSGPAGQAEAKASVPLTDAFNTVEAGAYQQAGYLVADVEQVWHTDDFSGAPVPLNVAEICGLTYMCTEQNLHPNPVGYAAIAAEFLHTIATAPQEGTGS